MSQIFESDSKTASDTVVCRCLNVTHSTISDCVNLYGAESHQEVRGLCGAGGGCMSCRSRIKQLIAQHQSNRSEARR
ncbi:BFD-like [2Fe-2S] binding domain protein [Thalassoglobus neptunius]|uniref:BFD-like [2Fe-2S] binding domain protein n=1 Tax=Thalassoglobus neptunius TaxID=1938619 RepID=A0A5C5WMM0_9PLAN|nr:(2Fe-2S)-binding protein [Thalassoglobus neptunius]TWT51868.1 BFD-like [2Fe-2S] binding domain protein [Thalassoglobus neptunius]